MVNDGSSDNTEEVAENWIIKDSRFKYIYKENGGLSSARNAGLDVAKGNYIQFLDADDCLDSQKISKSLASIKYHLLFNIIITHFKMFKDYPKDWLTSHGQLIKIV
nr:glycosyltransferase family 2 protein [Flavobacterium johnsoniae]